MSLRAYLFASCLAGLGLSLGGCGGSSTGLVPVDSPLIKHQPPPAEELVEPEPTPTASDAGDAADAGDDWGGVDDDSAGKP